MIEHRSDTRTARRDVPARERPSWARLRTAVTRVLFMVMTVLVVAPLFASAAAASPGAYASELTGQSAASAAAQPDMGVLGAGAVDVLALPVVKQDEDTPVATTYVDRTCVQPGDAKGLNDAQGTFTALGRWGDSAGSFTDRYGASSLDDMLDKGQRRLVFSWMMSGGNALWDISSSLVGFATRFCVLDRVGYTLDAAAASIGHSVINSPIIALLIVSAFVTFLFRRMRSAGGSWSMLLRPILATAFLVSLCGGAMNTTQVGVGTNFGAGSPGWYASKINRVISDLTGSLVLAAPDGGGSGIDGKGTPDDPASCVTYMSNMFEAYKSSAGSGALSEGTIAVPAMIDRMWQSTGLTIWIQIQYGKSEKNNFGYDVFCRQLDWVAGEKIGDPGDAATAGTRMGLQFNGQTPDVLGNEDAKFLWYSGPSKKTMNMLIPGWAACTVDMQSGEMIDRYPKMTITGRPEGGGEPVDIDIDCPEWAGITNSSDLENNSAYTDYRGDESHIDSLGPAEWRDFIATFNGFDNANSFNMLLAYVIASLGVLIVFGGMAVGIIIGKIVGAFTIIAVIVAIIMLIAPNANTDRITRLMKFYLGVTVLVFGISLVFSLLALVASVLTTIGDGAFASGSLLDVLWTGFSPLTSMVVLHFLFTKMLRMPSPMKLSSAMAFGSIASANAAGGAAAAGLNALGQRGKSAAANAGRRGLGLLTGGRAGRANTAGQQPNGTQSMGMGKGSSSWGGLLASGVAGGIGGAVAGKILGNKKGSAIDGALPDITGEAGSTNGIAGSVDDQMPSAVRGSDDPAVLTGGAKGSMAQRSARRAALLASSNPDDVIAGMNAPGLPALMRADQSLESQERDSNRALKKTLRGQKRMATLVAGGMSVEEAMENQSQYAQGMASWGSGMMTAKTNIAKERLTDGLSAAKEAIAARARDPKKMLGTAARIAAGTVAVVGTGGLGGAAIAGVMAARGANRIRNESRDDRRAKAEFRKAHSTAAVMAGVNAQRDALDSRRARFDKQHEYVAAGKEVPASLQNIDGPSDTEAIMANYAMPAVQRASFTPPEERASETETAQQDVPEVEPPRDDEAIGPLDKEQ